MANAAVRPVSPTTSVCAACASSSSCSRSRRDDRRVGPALERDPLGGLAGDLPVDGSGRLQDPHHLAQVDLREVDVGRVEVARSRRTGRAEGPERGIRRAPRGLQVETSRPRGQCMGVHSVAVTGASGLVGRHLLPVLAAHPDVDRVLGLDVREPERRPRTVEFAPGRHRRHRAEAAARGHRRGRAPRRCGRPRARRRAHGAGQRRGHPTRARRRRVGRRPPGRARLERDRLRRVGQQPGAAHRGRRRSGPTPTSRRRCRAPRSSGSSPSGGGVTPSVTVTTLRSAPVVGPGAERLPARILLGRPPLRVRGAGAAGAGGARRRPRRRRSRWWPREIFPVRTTSPPTAGSTPPRPARCIGRPSRAGAAGRGARALAAPHLGPRHGRRPRRGGAVPRAPVGDRQRAAPRRRLGARAQQRRRHRRGGRVAARLATRSRRSSPVPVVCCSWPAPRSRCAAAVGKRAG